MVEFVKNVKKLDQIFVNKLSAAERQLASALRCYFMEEDELAIHVVASSALNLYADLLNKQGKDPRAC